MEPLTIDIDRPEVRGGRYAATGQWVVFWAILALHHPDGSAMNAAELRSFKPWSAKAPASAGKEVSRHLGRTAARDWLHSELATREWRLAASRPPPCLKPSAEVVRCWLDARAVNAPEVPDLAALVAATIAFHDGRHADILDSLPATDGVPALAAWRDTLRARAAAKLGDSDLPESIREGWAARLDGSAETRAVVARLTVATALRDRTFTERDAVSRLRRLASHLEAHGDIATLGVVLNGLGVAQRRIGDFDASVAAHRRAAGLLGVVGDLYALQGALYNLALALAGRARAAGLGRPPEATTALHGCVALCERFDVARDSAQAELSAAKWAIEEGRRADAIIWLAKGEALARGIESELELALFHYVRGLARARWPELGGDAAMDFRIAEKLYAEGGDVGGAQTVRRAATSLGTSLPKKADSRGRR